MLISNLLLTLLQNRMLLICFPTLITQREDFSKLPPNGLVKLYIFEQYINWKFTLEFCWHSSLLIFKFELILYIFSKYKQCLFNAILNSFIYSLFLNIHYRICHIRLQNLLYHLYKIFEDQERTLKMFLKYGFP